MGAKLNGSRIIVGAAVLATLGTTAAPAAQIEPKPEQIARSYTFEIVQAAAKSLGLPSEVANDGDQRFVVIKLKQGAILAMPENCQKIEPAMCLSLEMQAIYSQAGVPFSVVGNFNDAQNFGQAFIHNGTVQLARTEYQVHGFPVGNVTESLRSFIDLATHFTQYLKESAHSAPGGAAPAEEKLPESALASANSFRFTDQAHLRTGVADRRYMDPRITK